MKKILHISNYYLPNKGGIEQVAYDIVSSLKGEYDQKVICFSGDGNNKTYKYDGVEVIAVGYVKKVASQAISFNYLKELKKVLDQFNPDIVHLHLPNPLVTFYYLLCKKKKDRELILHWHSDIVKQKNFLKFYLPIQERILKEANKIIVTSPNYKGSTYLRNYQEKLYIVPNVVDLEKFKFTDRDKEEVEKIKEKYKNKRIIFFLGRHVEYKGIEYLVKASQYLDENVKILIAGSGPLTSKLKEMSKGDSKIEFLGRVTDQELKTYLYAADIFAFPSITKNEAFGVALAEALYCKIPAVTFTIPGSGVNWVNKNGETGIEVSEVNSKAYAEALSILIENQELKEQLGNNASLRVKKKFNKKELRNYLIEIYGSRGSC